MPSYKIETQNHGPYWTATLDGYDGAPDATGPYSCVGRAEDEVDAIVDLLTTLDLEALDGSVEKRRR